MSISKSTEYGNINISLDAVASLAGGVVTECYGVVGMASQKFVKDGIAELLKKYQSGCPSPFPSVSSSVRARMVWNWIFISSSPMASRSAKWCMRHRRK